MADSGTLAGKATPKNATVSEKEVKVFHRLIRLRSLLGRLTIRTAWELRQCTFRNPLPQQTSHLRFGDSLRGVAILKNKAKRPTRRKPPRDGAKKSAPHQLSKAGARGLKESVWKNSPKTSPYYHIPKEPRIRVSDVVIIVGGVALIILFMWALTSVHRLGYDAGHGEGWSEGYSAGASMPRSAPQL